MSSGKHEPNALEHRLRQAIEAYHVSAIVYAAVKLNLPDKMAPGPCTAEQLAQALNLSPPHLYRFLRVLATIGICEEIPDRRFALTALGRILTAASPSDLREKAVIVVEQYWAPWADLMHSLQTGKPAFEKVFEQPLWDWRRANRDAGAIFDSWLAKICAVEAGPIVEAFDSSQAETIADIGGGNGAILAVALKAHRHLTGFLFDHPQTVEAALPFLAASGVEDRVTLVGGNFLENIPIRADLYLLKSVLHDWDDAHCVTILRNCRAAMPEHAKLLVIERLLPDLAADDPAAIMMDMHMMVVTGGKERSLDEHQALLAEARLAITGVTATPAGLSVIEAIPA